MPGPIQQLFNDPFNFVLMIVVFIFSLSVHESAHALVADRLGDPTGKMLGRITLNPAKHLELVGSLMFLFIGFGWARPVPVNPANLRGDGVRGLALVSAAGPVSNLALAFLAAMIMSLGGRELREVPYLLFFVQSGFVINVVLAVFNLLPIPMLDGFKVLLGLLPRPMAFNLSQLEPWGMGILMSLVALSWFTPINVFSIVLGPLVRAVQNAILSLTSRLF